MHSVDSGDTALPVTVTGAPEAPAPAAAVRHGVHIGTTADTCTEFTDLIRQTESGTGAGLSLADAVDGPERRWWPNSGIARMPRRGLW
jgi:hypothetical protein